MLAAIEDVKHRLQDAQNSLQVIRLAIGGIKAEVEDDTGQALEALGNADEHLRQICEIVENADDCLTRAYSKLDHH